MSILQLSKFSSIDELKVALKLLSKSDSENMSFLMVDDEVFMLTPGARARESITKRIAERLAESPSQLSELMDRLEREFPEDWE